MTSCFETKRQIGNTDLWIDTLGFGCASIGNLYHEISNDDARELLDSALAAGFGYFDTAPHYGQGLSERRLGDALRGEQHKDCVISTKVGRLLKPAGYAPERHGFLSPMPFDIDYDYSYDGIMRSFEHSLQRLGLDHIDILYMHDIGAATHGDLNESYFPVAMDGGYKAMDSLKEQGLVKAIGLGVNEYEVCEQALEYGDWDCFLLAGRYTLLEQDALTSFLPKCEQRGCSIIIGGAYNSGILATGVSGMLSGGATPYYNYEPAPGSIIERVKKIERVCDDFGVTLAAAALQFPMAHSSVASVIPGLGSKSRIEKTIVLFEQSIPNGFWGALKDQALLRSDAPTPDMTTDVSE